MDESHMLILPIKSQVALKQFCEKNNIKIEDHSWVFESKLLRTACMAPKCKFFMKKISNRRLKAHLALFQIGIPAFHKTIKLFCKETPEVIF